MSKPSSMFGALVGEGGWMDGSETHSEVALKRASIDLRPEAQRIRRDKDMRESGGPRAAYWSTLLCAAR